MIEVYRDAGVAMLADAAADRAAARHVVRRRAGAGAAVGARHAVDAPARRALRRVRLRADARARRPPAARLRSRLRLSDHADWPALLETIVETGAGRVLATHGHAEPLARFLREQGVDAGVIRTAWEDERRRRAITNEALRRASSPPSTARRRPTPRSRRWSRYFAAAPPADAAWAVFFLHRPSVETPLPYARHLRDWTMARDRPAGVAARRVLRRRRRRRRNGDADPRSIQAPIVGPVDDAGVAAASPSGSRQRILPLRQAPRRRAAASGDRLVARAATLAALHAVQAAHRRAAARRVADAGGAGAGPGRGASGDRGGGAAHGRMDAVGRVVRGAGRRPSVPTPTGRGPIRSASPRPSTASERRRSRAARRARRLAGRVEVGRHPRAADRARRRRLPVVARRRADHAIASPKIAAAAAGLPDGTVLDGEVLAWRGDRPLPFAALQQRIGRQSQVARTARDVPVVFMAYDVLEHDGVDVARRRCSSGARASRRSCSPPRAGPGRGASAAAAVDDAPVDAPPSVGRHRRATPARGDVARARGVEGLMLKRLRLGLRRRPQARRLVEMEDRSATPSTRC